MTEDKIRKVIHNLIELYTENPDRWKGKRFVLYEFLELLRGEFPSDFINKNFKWDLPLGVPKYGGQNPARVNLALFVDNERWIGIQILYKVSWGKTIESELVKCVSKLRTSPECKNMIKGFVLPMNEMEEQKIARSYNMTYKELWEKTLNKAKGEIKNAPIEIIEDGICSK